MRALGFGGAGFRVNVYTDSDQGAPNVAANPSTGGFQIVWESDGQDGDDWGVFARNFTASGQAVGGDISIADMTVGDQRSPDVALDENGNGMWVWSTTAIYNSAASEPDEPSIANTFPAANFRTSSKTFGFEETPGSDAEYLNFERLRDGGWDDDPVGKDAIEPSVISIGDDMFINGWYRKDEDRAEFRYAVDQVSADFDKVISANGDYSRGFAEADKEDRVYTNFGDVALLRTVDTRFGDKKEMVVVSTLASDLDARDGRIQFQIFQESPSAGLAFLYGDRLQTDYNGRPFLPESGLTGDASRPRVAVLENGDFAIVWMEENQTAANPNNWHSDVYVQIVSGDIDNGFFAVSPRVAVHNASGRDQEVPEIAATGDGGFVITWTDKGTGSDTGTVMIQRFDATGVRLDKPRMVDGGSAGDQSDAAVARLENNDLVVTWESDSGDGSGSSVQARILEVENYGPAIAQHLTGTSLGERFVTKAGNDTVIGEGGGDIINGGGGADRLFGGGGNDRVLGGNGSDRLVGGGGRDTLEGGKGNDRLEGGGGNDVIRGGGGNDFAVGGGGNDRIEGGTGADTLQGGGGADSLFGGDGADRLVGGQGADRLIGGAGADRLVDGGGRDVMRGGAGADTFVIARDNARDNIADWGTGNDTLDLSAYDATSDLRDVGKRQVGDHVDVLVGQQVILRLLDTRLNEFNIQADVDGF